MLVVDASVAIKGFLLEPGRDEARRLLDSEQRLIAPELIVAEVTNAMWKRVMAGQIDARQGAAATFALTQLLEPLLPIAPLAGRALAIAEELRHPAYDCFYLALAEARDLELITADRRLVAKLGGTRWQNRCLQL
ncbi:MAG TPA: type II toxin-antitoxin system VapC family toxin [Geminicoccaceae bacterium]|nr:type II toxin-antitoxin system VapC family toxin [Geminicoccaceae bacterium]